MNSNVSPTSQPRSATVEHVDAADTDNADDADDADDGGAGEMRGAHNLAGCYRQASSDPRVRRAWGL